MKDKNIILGLMDTKENTKKETSCQNL